VITQNTEKHARENRGSLSTIELIIRERNKGRSLRQLGQMFGMSHERVRQLLAKHSPSQVTLLAGNTAAARLGYPVTWLSLLRKEGILNLTKPGGRWLYSIEELEIITRFFPLLPACRDCWKLLE
jgi:hypothetical protein